MLIRFLFLSFGFLFTHRTIKFYTNVKPLPEAVLRTTSQILILYFWFLTVVSPWIHVLVLTALVLIPNVIALKLEDLMNFILRQKFQDKLLYFTDELLLLMMTGKSFRDSFLQLTNNPKDFFHFRMRELLLMINLQQTPAIFSHLEMIQISEVVQAIEKNPHRGLDKLRSFRRQLFWVTNFKRRSRQATTQIKAQALILSILYLGLLGFVWRQNNSSTLSLTLLSLALFLIGLTLLFILGKTPTWKT